MNISAVFLLVFLATMFGFSAWIFWNSFQPLFWKPVTGRFVRSSIVKKENAKDNGFRYYPQVFYTYTVKGSSYEGSQLIYKFSLFSGSYKFVEKQVSHFTPNELVIIYYNPRKPNQSVIQRFNPNAPIFGIISLVFGFFEIYTLVLLFSKR